MDKEYKREMGLLRDAAVSIGWEISESVSESVWEQIVQFGRLCKAYGEMEAKVMRAQDILLFQGFDDDEERRGRHGRH